MSMYRVCIYVGSACNLDCAYCIRHNPESLQQPADDVSDVMKDYLSTRTPDNCQAVVVTGGEPLLYLDRVYEIFSYVPKDVHKKIITNGVLLTQEVVDYANENNVELSFSYDGEPTLLLRGVDILENSKIVSLINQVNDLSFSATITKYNCDLYALFLYIKCRVNVKFHMLHNIMIDDDNNRHLTEGFDFELFERSMIECFLARDYYSPHYNTERLDNEGRNALLNGDVVTFNCLEPLGTVFDSDDVIVENAKKYRANCFSRDCFFRDKCCMPKQCASDFVCRCEAVALKVGDYINLKKEGLV